MEAKHLQNFLNNPRTDVNQPDLNMMIGGSIISFITHVNPSKKKCR